ncbi:MULTISPECIES: tetratricopeptide repeat protein [unclassified Streptomyces]|uniref:tetratricopeptide repeat protein n=1 Tax=unclassified Streptomyces TaxID=2593676 RepID=UPI0006AF5985|nr:MULTISPECIES: tetratricopeptide repeat protein [unclassified Streptomyces]
MTPAVDPAVGRAHADLLHLFRTGPAEPGAVCAAARDRLAATPDLDPGDPRTWNSYRLLTADVQTLLGYLREAGVPHSEPERFRDLLIRVLRHLCEADRAELGVLLAGPVHDDWRERLGEAHPDTLRAAERLAACLSARGDAERARPLLERILLLRSRTLGENAPATLLAACHLGACLNRLADHRAAFHVNDDAVRRCRRRLGKDDDTTLLATENLANSLFGLGRHQKALALHRDTHRRRTRTSGEDALPTLRAAADIALALHRLGDHESARAADTDLLRRLERTAGRDHSTTRATRDRLEKTLRSLGRTEEADDLVGAPKF